jgi:hypothetical protein
MATRIRRAGVAVALALLMATGVSLRHTRIPYGVLYQRQADHRIIPDGRHYIVILPTLIGTGRCGI